MTNLAEYPFILDMVNGSGHRQSVHLEIVNDATSKPRPQHFNDIAKGALLDRIFVYSLPEFAAGADAYERSREFDTNGEKEAFPLYNDNNFIELGVDFTKEQIQAALRKQAAQEDPEITQLRSLIIETVEGSKYFWDATRTVEEAERDGFTIDGCVPGILAYEN